MSAISDADDGGCSCTVTCDANNNITEIEEVQTLGMDTATLTTNFTYDWGNRLTQHKTLQYNNSQNDLWETERDHTIDAIGRTVKSGFREYWGDEVPPTPDTLEHTYDRSKMLQNYDGSSYGEVWHWAGHAEHAFSGDKPRSALRCIPVVRSSASIQPANRRSACTRRKHTSAPQRRTFTNPTSEGDQRHLYGQGKPQAKNSSGSGANWYLGTESDSISIVKVNSRTMFDGTVTATDMDRATDAREKGRIGIFGTGNAYAGSSGRVTSERIGRDLNPLGRGDGMGYVAGSLKIDRVAPRLPHSKAVPGTGFSINNSGQCGLGGCGSSSSGFSSAGLGGTAGLTTQESNCDWCCKTFYDRNGRWEGDVPLDCYRCDCEARDQGPGGGPGGSGGGTIWGAGDCEKNSKCWKSCWSRKNKDIGNQIGFARCSGVGHEKCIPFLYKTNCKFCWPTANEHCLACHVYRYWNPCYCAKADCDWDCFLDAIGASDLLDALNLTVECSDYIRKIWDEDAADGSGGASFPCPFWSSDGQGGTGGSEGIVESDPVHWDCFIDLYDQLKKIKDDMENLKDDLLSPYVKYIRCLVCCHLNMDICTHIGLAGKCNLLDPLREGRIDNHWLTSTEKCDRALM